jgi:site-specific DNA recombinase
MKGLAATYARFSSDLQSPTSIEDQQAICNRYAAERGWHIVEAYSDAAITGFTSDRPGYRRLLADAESRRFKAVLVESVDRLSRDLGELMRLYHSLRFAGVEIIGVRDGVATGERSGKLGLTVKGLVADLYLEDLREKTHRGLEGRFRRGLSAGGKTFGLRSEEIATGFKLGIDDAESEIVRRIWSEFAAGRSVREIVDHLNAEKVPFPAKDTKRGPERIGWASSSVHFILRNPTYEGRFVWNKREFRKDPDTGKRRPILRPENDWIVEERPELRIVPEALAARVKARLDDLAERHAASKSGRSRGPSTRSAYSRKYLLTGFLRCGRCGARMAAQTFTRKKRDRTYATGRYYCTFARTKGPSVCAHTTAYRQDVLEGALLDRLAEATRAEHLENLAARVNDVLRRATKNDPARERELRSELEKTKASARRLVLLLADGGAAFPSIREELAGLEKRRAETEDELSRFEQSRDKGPPTLLPVAVTAYLGDLLGVLKRDLPRVKAEIARHLDGDLILSPRLSPAAERWATITGKVSPAGLLGPFSGPGGVLPTVHCGGRI